mmetsp:Transcript_22291/g.46621  ORF Transcript_22291/g.46621 Transcript_22291/m.46621 type:complete len:144 (+) Transcript_22291:41-472(+)
MNAFFLSYVLPPFHYRWFYFYMNTFCLAFHCLTQTNITANPATNDPTINMNIILFARLGFSYSYPYTAGKFRFVPKHPVDESSSESQTHLACAFELPNTSSSSSFLSEAYTHSPLPAQLAGQKNSGHTSAAFGHLIRSSPPPS